MLEKFKINKKLLRELDFSIIAIAIIIVVFSAFNIYSATYRNAGMYFFKRQIVWLFIGLAVMYLIMVFDYTVIEGYTDIIYWSGVLLLLLNDTVFKSTANGAGSWMKIGSVTIGQPSELAKLGMILMIAKKVHSMEGNLNTLKNIMTIAIYAAIPMVLIVIQPDMGMTMVCFFAVLGMIFIAGVDMKIIFGGLAGLTASIGVIWNIGLIKPYQKARLISFLHPEEDELGTGLQLIQSKIGIGSGGIFGKGFLKGTQIAGGFIPESHTDFIFAVVGEEWGLLGALVLISLYGILIYKFINIARTAKDTFGSIICAGIVSMLIFSLLQNIGMTIGLMPITGITLPLMSYGGSSMLAIFISIGLVLNVGMRRKKINF